MVDMTKIKEFFKKIYAEFALLIWWIFGFIFGVGSLYFYLDSMKWLELLRFFDKSII